MIDLRPAHDPAFACELSRVNMVSYYQQHAIDWQQELFDASWSRMENFEVFHEGRRVGVLRLSQTPEALWIRDLQISPEWQNQGIGTQVLNWAREATGQRGLRRLCLRVFETNPAKDLYKRLGFEETGRDDYLILMQANLL